MAYANNYTYMYGFSLLDDLHNFFPEILYDDTLFPEQRFGWFRHRTSTLFPTVFTRQMNMYRIYSAGERQRMFNEWIHSQTIGIASQQQQQQQTQAQSAAAAATTPAATAAPPAVLRPVSTLRYTSPTRTYSQAANTLDEIQTSAANILLRMSESAAPPQTPQRPPAPIQPTAPQRRGVSGRAAALESDIDVLTALFSLPTIPINNATRTSPTINSLFGANEILSLLTNSLNFQDVLVIPTTSQIEAASRIILHIDVPADENCAICQEHTIPGQQSSWRRLHCSHQFHTSCIMSWFQRDVHCPVCRSDIRELGESETPRDDMSMSSNETAPTSQP